MEGLVIAIIVLAVILCSAHDKNCDAMENELEKKRENNRSRGCSEEDCENCKFKLTCMIEKVKSI